MRKYTPRKQSRRWLDSDCPNGVLAILDAGKTTNDRWTVIYAEPVVSGTYGETILWYRGMCNSPSSPCGVGCSGELPAYAVAALRYRQRSAAWSALPEAVKACVRADMES